MNHPHNKDECRIQQSGRQSIEFPFLSKICLKIRASKKKKKKIYILSKLKCLLGWHEYVCVHLKLMCCIKILDMLSPCVLFTEFDIHLLYTHTVCLKTWHAWLVPLVFLSMSSSLFILPHASHPSCCVQSSCPDFSGASHRSGCEAALVIALAWPEESTSAAIWPQGLPHGHMITFMLPCLMRWKVLVLSGAESTIELVLLSSLSNYSADTA